MASESSLIRKINYAIDKKNKLTIILNDWKNKVWVNAPAIGNAGFIWEYNDTIYWSREHNHRYLDGNEWKTKTWNIDYIDGSCIWYYKGNVYLSQINLDTNILENYKLINGVWEQVTWRYNNVNPEYILGYNMWYDLDGKVYAIYQDNYYLDENDDTWKVKDWGEYSNNLTSSLNIWDDGKNIYYSRGQYQFILVNGEFIPKTWINQPTNNDGNYIWKDENNNVYSSNYSYQYYLDGDTWRQKIWKTMSNFVGYQIWHYNHNCYLQNSYELKDLKTWDSIIEQVEIDINS